MKLSIVYKKIDGKYQNAKNTVEDATNFQQNFEKIYLTVR